MSMSTVAGTVVVPVEVAGTDNLESGVKASWRSLFAFTTRKHTASLAWCALATFFGGLLKPVAAIFFGNVFSVLTQFGIGTLDSHDTLHQISIWCIALIVVGIAAWVLHGMFLSSWMVFGELQARSVREQMFIGLLNKDMEWFDLRKDGIGALLIRIQT